jgi:hypothetical protein
LSRLIDPQIDNQCATLNTQTNPPTLNIANAQQLDTELSIVFKAVKGNQKLTEDQKTIFVTIRKLYVVPGNYLQYKMTHS